MRFQSLRHGRDKNFETLWLFMLQKSEYFAFVPREDDVFISFFALNFKTCIYLDTLEPAY